MEIAFVLALLPTVFILFVLERHPPEVVAMLVLSLLLATGILNTQEVLSVFSNSATVTIAMLFILSAGLERTGVLQRTGRWLQTVAAGSALRAMLAMMVLVVIASAFMNNTPIVIMMTPVVIALAASVNISPARMLIPLSFCSIFGGTLTLVGTSTNILMSSIATDSGQPAIGMFEMTPVGLVFAITGIVYTLLASKFLLRDRDSFSDLYQSKRKRCFLAEVLLPRDSRFHGKPLRYFNEQIEAERLIAVIRGHQYLEHPGEELLLQSGDRIVLETCAGQLVELKQNGALSLTIRQEGIEPVHAERSMLIEASIGPTSRLRHKRLGELSLAQEYGSYVLAVHRHDTIRATQLDQVRLQFADTLLLEGPPAGIRRMLADGAVSNLTAPLERPTRRSKAPLAMVTVLAVMLLAALDIMPIAGLAVMGATVMLLGKCIDPDEAFAAIDWRVIFLIFGMLGLSMALEKTGAASLIVDQLTAVAPWLGPLGLLLVVYVMTSALTEIISNNAVALLLGPIVIELATTLGYDPRAFIMAVMFAASASFATPIGYQTNTFVYRAGGYQFMDFVRIGLPLNILFAVIAVFVIPLFFPLTAP